MPLAKPQLMLTDRPMALAQPLFAEMVPVQVVSDKISETWAMPLATHPLDRPMADVRQITIHQPIFGIQWAQCVKEKSGKDDP